jgi:hypothetical protein
MLLKAWANPDSFPMSLKPHKDLVASLLGLAETKTETVSAAVNRKAKALTEDLDVSGG